MEDVAVQELELVRQGLDAAPDHRLVDRLRNVVELEQKELPVLVGQLQQVCRREEERVESTVINKNITMYEKQWYTHYRVFPR